MSRKKDNYENSLWLKFKKWIDGETDLLADGMEIRVPEKDSKVLSQAAQSAQVELTGYDPAKAARMRKKEEHGLLLFHRFYQVMSVLLCLTIIFVLLWTIAYLPVFGNAGNPDNNEVSARYIEKGVEETGALNYVTGMILDYRAFDTFGESCVLFIASCCVLALLRIDAVSRDAQTRKRLDEANDRLFEPKNDIILQKCACVLVPFIMIFGIYIILNGHLSPGGGFSGGAVLGSGLILYLNAFGFEKTERFFTEKVYRRITLCALTFYCVAKSYSFFTGANHLESGIPLGTPGAILSSGLILLLHKNLIKKIMGMNIMDTAVYLFLAAKGYIQGRAVPIEMNGIREASAYINPVPSGLVLTGIVVSVSTTALMLALTIRLYERYGSLDLDEILTQAKEEEKT